MKSRADLEAIVLGELKKVRHRESASSVTVYNLKDRQSGGDWAVASFNPGTSGIAACEQALAEIETRLRAQYEMIAD
jgi:hypothetical protein